MKSCPVCEKDFPDQHTNCPTDGAVLIASAEMAPDTVVRGKYRIVRKLGQGGMGSVYLAEHMLLSGYVALKFLAADLSSDLYFVRRFRNEARAAYALRHANIVQVMDLDQAEDGSLFLAMEYVDGPSLREALRRAPSGFALTGTFEIARGVLAGLVAAHERGIVHRDIKPENILLTTGTGGRCVPRILDFGIAAMLDGTATATSTKGLLLTPGYAAPEQWRGTPGSQLDGRTDLYAFGGVWYEMLTGSTPFHAHNTEGWMYHHLHETARPPSELRPEIARVPGLDSLVLRLLSRDREQRPESVEACLAELEGLERAMSQPAIEVVTPPPEPPAPAPPVAAEMAVPLAIPSAPQPVAMDAARPPSVQSPVGEAAPTDRDAQRGSAVAAVAEERDAPESEQPKNHARAERENGGRRTLFTARNLAFMMCGCIGIVLVIYLTLRFKPSPPRNAPPAEIEKASENGLTDSSSGSKPAPPTGEEGTVTPGLYVLKRTVSGDIYPMGIALNPQGDLLATWDYANGDKVRVWNTQGSLISDKHRFSEGANLAFDPSGALLAMWWLENVYLVTPEGKVEKTLPIGKDKISDVAFSPNSPTMAIGFRTTVQLWDYSNAAKIYTFNTGPAENNVVAFSRDGRYLASADRQGTIKVWEITSKHNVRTFIYPSGVYALAFPSNELLAAGGSKGDVIIWRLGDGEKRSSFRVINGDTPTLWFSPDGQLVGSTFGFNCEVWDVMRGSRLQKLGQGVSIAFSKDNSVIAVGEDHAGTRIYERQ